MISIASIILLPLFVRPIESLLTAYKVVIKLRGKSFKTIGVVLLMP